MINISSEGYLLENHNTSMEIYLKLRSKFNEQQLFLLESLSGPNSDNQQAIIGFNPIFNIKIKKNTLQFWGEASICNLIEDSFTNSSFVEKLTSYKYNVLDLKNVWGILRLIESVFKIEYNGEPTNLGVGFFGYFGYDTVRYVEDLPYSIEDDTDIPDLMLSIYQGIFHIDFMKNTTYLTINKFHTVDINLLYTYEQILEITGKDYNNSVLNNHKKIFKPDKVEESVTKKEYLTWVQKALGHIAAGDIYQIQLGHSISIESKIDPFTVYLRKRELNPSPYMYFVQMEDLTIIGASPELFVRINNGEVTMRPIAGTIRRGKNFDEDEKLKEQLKNDTKECAEHIMLVDLCRNDIGHICDTDTLNVTELMIIEKYSHVFHIVSNVIGRVNPKFDKYDVMAATFPAGTMTGAPKVRAMEIIEDTETSRRQIYAGSIGFIDFNGNVETALCIRTSFYKNGTYSIRASAGIVADSIAENEWLETITKMSSSYKAITGLGLKNEPFIN